MRRGGWRALILATALAAGAARAGTGWRAEFDEICAKTQDAMALSVDELKGLIERCDKLLPEVEKLGDSERKVFVKRLLACKNLYAFVLETRQGS
jgi:hypothetical protein